MLSDGADSTYDRVEHRYNRQGEVTETKDQNGTIHAFDFDDLGRQTHDRVTTLGTNIDNSVLRLSRTYEVRGMLEKATSYDNATVGSGTVVNEIKREYNDFGQLVAEYQEHGAAVNTSNSPKVQYSYTDGSNNRIRRTKMTYPNGRILRYEYNTGDDDNLSRISFLADDDSGSVGTHLAEYTYLGLNAFVKVDYTEPDIRMDLAHGTGNDPYDGLDDFDRVVDLLWRDYGSSTDVVRIQHGYDRAGNRLYREDPVAAANSKDFDELYSYDGVHRLANMKRGNLNTAKDGIASGTLNFEQDWSLEPLGNWSTFKEDTDGDTTWDLDQSRSHSESNEITDIDSSSTHVAHDRNGNITKIPKPDDWSTHLDLTWDAWNRLVKVKDASNTIVVYVYDGRRRRTSKKLYVAGVVDETRHYYISAKWQVLEERTNGSLAAERQYVWGLRHLDDLLLRERDTSDPLDGLLDERLYCQQDANWNVSSITTSAGTVSERYSTASFGSASYFDSNFTGRSGSSFDWTYLLAGREYDDSVSLYQYRARVYSPALGRFLSRDPLRYLGSFNAYAYVDNNPILNNDPLGLLSAGQAESLVSLMLSRVTALAKGLGRSRDLTDEECARHVLLEAKRADMLAGLAGVGRGVAFAPLEAAVGGFWKKLSVEVLKEVAEGIQTGELPNDEDIVNKLVDKLELLGEKLTPEEFKLARKLLANLARQHLKHLPGECRTVTINKESIFKTGGTSITCEFLVCGKTERKGILGILGEDVTDWKILGGCRWTCKVAKNRRGFVLDACCCGSSGIANIVASGSSEEEVDRLDKTLISRR